MNIVAKYQPEKKDKKYSLSTNIYSLIRVSLFV